MLITEDDIKKIQSELTEEQWKQFVYLLSEPELNRLKNIIKEQAKVKFIGKLRKYITKFIKQLNSDTEVRPETTNLLFQSKLTLKNVHKLIKNKSISDANALLRSCFENIMMAMLINQDENTYKEYINLSIKYKDRKYTRPYQIRDNFGNLLIKLDKNLFDELTNDQLNEMLDDLYESLCNFAHSTLMVNAIVELRKEDDLDLYIVALKQNAYFIELVLYLCLKYLCNSKSDPLDITYILLGWFVLISEVPKERLNQEYIDKLNSLFHIDYNKDYIEKNKEKNESLIKEATQLQNDIKENPLGFINILKEFIKII